MYLSGSVGYTLLKNNNKYVLLLADIHNGVSYCDQSVDNIMIDKWLSLKDDNNILLEEVVREEFSLTDLWPGAEHTQRLKQLNQNNKKIKPIDIRPLLIPYSWELLGYDDTKGNNEQQNMLLEEYLLPINNIFNYKKTKLMMTYFIKELQKLDINADVNIKKLLFQHFQEMKILYNEFIINNNSYLKKSMIEIFNSKQELLEEINNITSMIMEWYILLLILNNNENSIIHLGLAHSNRILDFLTDVYSFEVIKKTGINMIAQINQKHHACLLVPDIINTKFK